MFAGHHPINKVNSDNVLNSVRRQSNKVSSGNLSQKEKIHNQQQIYGAGNGNGTHSNRFQ